MTTVLAAHPKEAYSLAVDRKLSDLRKSQDDSHLIAHSIWESLSVLETALNHNVKDLEYSLYFDLIKRKVIEYGVANIRICDKTLAEHIDSVDCLIVSKKAQLSLE